MKVQNVAKLIRQKIANGQAKIKHHCELYKAFAVSFNELLLFNQSNAKKKETLQLLYIV